MKVHLKEQSFFTRKKSWNRTHVVVAQYSHPAAHVSFPFFFFLTKNLITTLQKRRLLSDIPSPLFCLTMPLGTTTERACWPVLSTPGTIFGKKGWREISQFFICWSEFHTTFTKEERFNMFTTILYSYSKLNNRL